MDGEEGYVVTGTKPPTIRERYPDLSG